MSESKPSLPPEWDDPDLPEWTDEMFDYAQLSIGDKVIREATGSLTRDGMRPFGPGRPPLGTHPKRQVTLRVDPDVLDRFRAGGPGWQSRMNAALRQAVGL